MHLDLRRRGRHLPAVSRSLVLPPFVPPAAPRLVAAPPVGPSWLHEPKLDGWRCELAKAGPRVALYTRSGYDLSPRAKHFAARAAAIPVHRCLLDGELVAVAGDGMPDFLALPAALRGLGAELLYFAFDILVLEGRDLTRLPTELRKQYLTEVVANPISPGSQLWRPSPTALPFSPCASEWVLKASSRNAKTCRTGRGHGVDGPRSGATAGALRTVSAGSCSRRPELRTLLPATDLRLGTCSEPRGIELASFGSLDDRRGY